MKPQTPRAAPAPPGREQPLAAHLSTPLEAPWARAYQSTLDTLTRRLATTLAGYASPRRS
jgi:hypothetical protein